MKRLLPLALLSLLLLAPAARGGDLEDIARDIQDVDVQMQYLVDALDQTEDPQERAVLQGQLDNARAHRAKLEADRVGVRALLDAAAEQHSGLGRRAEAMVEKLTALRDQALGRRRFFVARGEVKHAEAMGPAVERAEQELGRALDLQDVLAGAEVQLRDGALHATQQKLTEAKARLDDLESMIRAKEEMQHAAAAAEHAAEEDARRKATADEIAHRLTVAEAGIEEAQQRRAEFQAQVEGAAEAQDAVERARIRTQLVRLEARSAKLQVARGWLEKARALLAASDILEAQKALVQAKAALSHAARETLDDAGQAWLEDKELLEDKHRISELRRQAVRSLEAARQARAELQARLQQAGAAGEQAEIERLTERVREVRAQAAGLEAARETLEQAALLIDGRRYEEAKQAFERAKRRLEEVAARHPELADVAETSDRPFHGADPAADAHAEALRTQIAELEAQLAELSKRVTDKHEAHIRLSQRIRALKENLASLESRRALGVREVVTDEDGRFVIVGHGDDTYRVRLVTGDLSMLLGRAERVVGPDGVVVPGATTLDKTARSVATRAVSLKDVWSPKRVDHLRQAAKHLREAGQIEQAERLERQATELEASLRRYTAGRSGGAGSAAVLKAIGDLRQEVRALRKEVKELKQLILENR